MTLARLLTTPVLVGTLAMTVGCAAQPKHATNAANATVSLAVPEKAAEAAMPPAAAAEAAPVPAAATPPPVEDLVATCAKAPKGRACSLTAADVASLCREMSPDRALKAFASGTKLSRAFLAGDVDAWSTISGVRTSKTKATFDEEVLVLSEVRARGGIVISGAAVSYEVLRWDGTCATLSGGELTFKRPPAPKRPVDFGKLDDATLRWLGADASLETAEAARAKTCAKDDATATCAKARSKRDAALGRFVFGR